MSQIVFAELSATPATPTAGKVRAYIGSDSILRSVNSAGVVTVYSSAITQEQVEDYVGNLLQDTATVNVTYNDAGNVVTFDVIPGGISHTGLANIGTNTHAQIDTHIANTSNPHSTTAAQVGNTTAQWNADKLQSVNVSATAPTNGQLLTYSSANTRWEPAALGSAVTLPNSQVTSAATTTTISLVDVTLTGMSITPASGTYLVNFSCSTVNSANGASRNWFTLNVAGTAQTGSEREVGISGGAYVPASTHALVTVNGSQAITVTWRVAGGTGTVLNRTLSAVRVG